MHWLPVLEVPLHDKFAVLVDVDMSRTVVANPSNEYVSAAAYLRHLQMLS